MEDRLYSFIINNKGRAYVVEPFLWATQTFGAPHSHYDNNPNARWGAKRMVQHKQPGFGSQPSQSYSYRYWFTDKEDASLFVLQWGDKISNALDWSRDKNKL